MNIYKRLNQITKYIEEHLAEEIKYEDLAKIIGVDVYTMRRIFLLLSNITISEYIRKRRLSNALFDLINKKQKVMDIAVKYQYDSATSFSRAFYHFHGIKPSKVNQNTLFKNFPRIVFDENIQVTEDIEYKIVDLDTMTLYGVGIKVTNETISHLAPKFFSDSRKKYESLYGDIPYGIVTYHKNDREFCNGYYIAYDKKIEGFQKIIIPKGKWLLFTIPSYQAKDIQKVSKIFYVEFLPSSKYNLRETVELEYYHDGITEFLIPIY